MIAALLLMFAGVDIVDASATKFTVRTTMSIDALPSHVYRKLIANIGDWWDPQQTISHDAHNLRLEDRPGGFLREKMPDGGFIRHFEVVSSAPDKSIVLKGVMGFLEFVAYDGLLQIQLAPIDTKTELQVSYSVTGYLSNGMNTQAPAADREIAHLFKRLKNYLETGAPSK